MKDKNLKICEMTTCGGTAEKMVLFMTHTKLRTFDLCDEHYREAMERLEKWVSGEPEN